MVYCMPSIVPCVKLICYAATDCFHPPPPGQVSDFLHCEGKVSLYREEVTTRQDSSLLSITCVPARSITSLSGSFLISSASPVKLASSILTS